jgi:hypothetical protein
VTGDGLRTKAINRDSTDESDDEDRSPRRKIVPLTASQIAAYEAMCAIDMAESEVRDSWPSAAQQAAKRAREALAPDFSGKGRCAPNHARLAVSVLSDVRWRRARRENWSSPAGSFTAKPRVDQWPLGDFIEPHDVNNSRYRRWKEAKALGAL